MSPSRGSKSGKALRLGTRRIVAGDGQTFTGRLRIAHPRLWSPVSPHLYTVHLTVRAHGRKVAGYALHSGIRSIKVVNGRFRVDDVPPGRYELTVPVNTPRPRNRNRDTA